MKLQNISKRIDELLALADGVIESTTFPKPPPPGRVPLSSGPRVDSELFQQFRSSSLSFLNNVFGGQHIFYKEFIDRVKNAIPSDTTRGRAILRSAKEEIDGGWLLTVKGIASAEIFTDFLEMAGHLLQEGYKDPAAVMMGSVLEEHLRQLCAKNGIDTTTPDAKSGKDLPKKADRMNSDLASASVYNKLYQKTITGWLDLRNQAAHGHYSEYDSKQVKLMEDGVTDFIAKTS